jgi:CRISPR/Cas system CMR-associated protein Cmr5 small subunit
MSQLSWLCSEIEKERRYKKEKLRAFWRINGHMLLDLANGKEITKNQKSMAQLELDRCIDVLKYEIDIIKNIKEHIKEV